MHPVVAQIHPSIRTAFFAFFIGRTALYLALHAVGQSPLDVRVEGGLLAEWLRILSELANTHVDSIDGAGDWLRFVLNETAVFLGLIGLYRFVRRDAMPQGADRAVWFAACSPLMFLTLPGADWAFVFAMAMWSLEIVAAGHAIWGSLLFMIGVMTRPDLLVLWPGFAAVCLRGNSTDKWQTWVGAVLPLLAFATRVLWAVLFGDPDSLYTYEAAWRTEWAWEGWSAHLGDLGILGMALFGVLLALHHVARRPRAWLVMAIPCLVWPVLHEPSTAAVGTLLVCAPAYGYLGAFTEDPARERLLMGLSLLGLVALALL